MLISIIIYLDLQNRGILGTIGEQVFTLSNGVSCSEGCPVSLLDEYNKPFHKDSIRAIRYGVNGKLLVSAGDDKLVKIWSSDTWHCIGTVYVLHALLHTMNLGCFDY